MIGRELGPRVCVFGLKSNFNNKEAASCRDRTELLLPDKEKGFGKKRIALEEITRSPGPAAVYRPYKAVRETIRRH